ncbi:MAG: hypothetical protein U1A77_23880 [Pirellulales bacterium]
MKTLLRTLAVVALALLISVPAVAQEKKKKGKGGNQTPQAVAAIQKQLEGLDLSDEQKGKIKEVVASYSGKLTEAQKKVGGLMTAEQRAKAKEATDKAKADGKKGKELRDAVEAAVGLSGDDKAKMQAAQKEVNDLAGEFRKAVAEVLTDEQKAKAGLNAPEKGKGKKKKTQ